MNENRNDVPGAQESTSQSYSSNFPLSNNNRDNVEEFDNSIMQVCDLANADEIMN